MCWPLANPVWDREGPFLLLRKKEPMDIRVSILRLRKVLERTGFSRSTLYLRIAAGSFPRPISLGGRSVGWVDSEVDAWIASRVAESRSESK